MNLWKEKLRPLACRCKDFLLSRTQKVKFFRAEGPDDSFPEESSEDPALTFRTTDSWEGYRSLCESSGSHFSEESLRRLDAGDVFAAICLNGQAVSWGWYAWKHRFWIEETDTVIDLQDSETCMLYDFYTREAYRGRGYYPLLLRKMMQSRKACSAFLIYCRKDNTASEKGIRKAGFKPVGPEGGLRHGEKGLKNLLEKEAIRVLGSNYRLPGMKKAFERSAW